MLLVPNTIWPPIAVVSPHTRCFSLKLACSCISDLQFPQRNQDQSLTILSSAEKKIMMALSNI